MYCSDSVYYYRFVEEDADLIALCSACMYVCVRVCVFVCVLVWLCVRECVCVCVCLRARARARARAYVRAHFCMRVCVCEYVNVCVRAWMRVYAGRACVSARACVSGLYIRMYLSYIKQNMLIIATMHRQVSERSYLCTHLCRCVCM